jgi:hypothetical protein
MKSSYTPPMTVKEISEKTGFPKDLLEYVIKQGSIIIKDFAGTELIEHISFNKYLATFDYDETKGKILHQMGYVKISELSSYFPNFNITYTENEIKLLVNNNYLGEIFIENYVYIKNVNDYLNHRLYGVDYLKNELSKNNVSSEFLKRTFDESLYKEGFSEDLNSNYICNNYKGFRYLSLKNDTKILNNIGYLKSTLSNNDTFLFAEQEVKNCIQSLVLEKNKYNKSVDDEMIEYIYNKKHLRKRTNIVTARLYLKGKSNNHLSRNQINRMSPQEILDYPKTRMNLKRESIKKQKLSTEIENKLLLEAINEIKSLKGASL